MQRVVLLTLLLLAATPGTAAAVAPERIERVIDASLTGLLARQLPWGGFDDPLAGPRFGYGAVALGWLAGGEAGARSLRAGTRVAEPGGFQAWIEALQLTAPARDVLDEETRHALEAHAAAYRGPKLTTLARPCWEDPRCFHNLELVDAVGTLQRARAGLSADLARAREVLAVSVPRAQRRALALRLPGRSAQDGAVISDGSRRPLAYHTLSTALLVRALRLLGPEAPVSARRAAIRGLWALVALADPHGDVTWMGRGQQHVWSSAATVYASLAGAAEFGLAEPALAARLRGLAELAFAEIERRLGPHGLAPVPGVRRSLAGMDRSADTIACNGLALLWLRLASAETTAGAAAPIPAHVPGAATLDTAAGVATLRTGRTWLAVHREATHPRDARYDVGLLAAHTQRGGGWRSVVGQRPNTDAESRLPSSGPLLLAGGRAVAPAGRLSVTADAIRLDASWGSLRYRALADGVELSTPCPRRRSLRLIEWVAGAAGLGARAIRTDHRIVTFSARARVRWLAGVRSSAAHDSLRGARIEIRCAGAPVRIAWRARG